MERFDTALLILRLWLEPSYSPTASTTPAASTAAPRVSPPKDSARPGSTPPGLALIATMTVAFGSIHRFDGFFVFKRPDEGWEHVATLAVAALAIAAIGPGSVSLDAALGLEST